jgi:hypothetical protein
MDKRVWRTMGKSRSGACSHCSARAAGRPRTDRGICSIGKRAPIYRARRQWREWERAARSGEAVDPPPVRLFRPKSAGRYAADT